MIWRIENTGRQSGVFNMRRDEALAHELVSGNGSSIVRLFGWAPPAISLGWNQSPDELDEARARREGIDIVRRPTGGRAILHSDELTYSVVMNVRGRNVHSVYEDISNALVAGLRALGADVSIEKSQPHFPTLYRSASAVACFSSSARYEIQWKGRKLVGSAQRRYAVADGSEVVLQHGSILLGPDHRRMIDFLRLKEEAARETLRRQLADHTTDLMEILGRRVTFEESAAAIQKGFERSWGIVFEAVPAPHAHSVEAAV